LVDMTTTSDALQILDGIRVNFLQLDCIDALDKSDVRRHTSVDYLINR